MYGKALVPIYNALGPFWYFAMVVVLLGGVAYLIHRYDR
jgi:hypothetical protein